MNTNGRISLFDGVVNVMVHDKLQYSLKDSNVSSMNGLVIMATVNKTQLGRFSHSNI